MSKTRSPCCPEVKTCPLAGYLGTAPVLTLLTRKGAPHHGDICVGADEQNECHDGTGIGGHGQRSRSQVHFE